MTYPNVETEEDANGEILVTVQKSEYVKSKFSVSREALPGVIAALEDIQR